MKILQDKSGFTLIELLLAMTLFSAVMVIATVGFIGMNRTFRRGVIRKNLSESAQAITEDLTRTIRSQNVNTSPQPCNETNPDPDCAAGFSAICFGQTRYFWKSKDTNDANNTGLYKDNSQCQKAPSDQKTTLLSDTYKVRALSITSVNSGSGLFQIKGVLTTADPEALNSISGDPYQITCRGTAESSSVRTCAVEKFNFIVSTRNQQ